MNNLSPKTLYLFVFLMLQSTLLFAIESNSVIDAKPLLRQASKYPSSASKTEQEGWVVVNYVINKKGKVVDPFVEDSSGVEDFEKAALKAIKKWKYTPATQNGQPIEQSNRTAKFDFNIAGGGGLTEKFTGYYTSLMSAIKANDLDSAEVQLTKMSNRKFWNYTESSYYWLADATYAKAIQDEQRELISINKALAVENDKINTSSIAYLLVRQFTLNLTSTYFSAAVDSYKKLQNNERGGQYTPTLQQYFDEVMALIESDESLIRQATLNKLGRLSHNLSRNNFSIKTNDGSVSNVEIRCENKRSKFKYDENNVWKIPEKWGQCEILLSGRQNTSVSITELGNI